MLGATNTTAQLMQLCKAKDICIMDHHGVGNGNIDATLNDGGRHQDVCLVAHELEHDFLKHGRRHLAMTNQDARVWHHGLHFSGHFLNVIDAVMNKEHLPLPRQFTPNRLLNSAGIPGNHLRHNGATVQRRGSQARDIANTKETHVQRARDGRGTQRQHIRGQSKCQQALLVFNAEALFFINDHQTQVRERNVLTQDAMRTDHYIHLTGGEIRQHHLALGTSLKARQTLNAKRIRTESIAEGALVLLGKHGGWYQNGNLPTALHRLERGTNGHFGLSKSDIATNQSVHGAR